MNCQNSKIGPLCTCSGGFKIKSDGKNCTSVTFFIFDCYTFLLIRKQQFLILDNAFVCYNDMTVFYSLVQNQNGHSSLISPLLLHGM